MTSGFPRSTSGLWSGTSARGARLRHIPAHGPHRTPTRQHIGSCRHFTDAETDTWERLRDLPKVICQ